MKDQAMIFRTILGIFLLFGFVFLSGAQGFDVEPLIKTIRQQYAIIAGKEIPNLQIDTLDFTEPWPDDEDGYGGTWSIFEIYHTGEDTFKIRHENGWDEGGAYFAEIVEVYFWDKKPFFFFVQSEGLWEALKKETRVYLHNRQIIRKLYKEGIFYTPEEGSFDLDMSQLPNQTMPIRDQDLTEVYDRISGFRSELANH